ncbi:capsule assembly Wzi family protein [Nibrella viscosa]|uniref:Capsule assembly Wzi family protein n=1 Tax=Nibrella viscosa TaxID=1084524 RepID=A0ABP8K0Y3_9BACT
MRFLGLIFLIPTLVWGQFDPKAFGPTHIFGEAGGYYAPNQQTPFWLRANQFGTVPVVMPYGALRLGFRHDERYHRMLADTDRVLARKAPFFGLSYGVEAVLNAGKTQQVIVPEAYLTLRLGPFEIWGGRRREVIGLADSTMGVGPYAWSGNALPIPKIQVTLPNYVPVPMTAQLLAVQGFLAHGWFNNGFVQRSYLHQKALYVRFGRPRWPIHLIGGINHQVQWGGTETDVLSTGYIRGGRFPAGWGDYRDVVTAKSLGTRLEVDTTRYSPFDRWNRLGNHLGTVDVGMEITGREYSLLVYRQSIYEDGSLFYLTNIVDGLNGIRFTNRRRLRSVISLQQVLAEFLYTRSQGGAVFSDSPARLRGRDNYFNHGQYRDGWSYLGQTIGTPFITPWYTTRPELPPNAFTNNNRVMVFHAALNLLIRSRYSVLLKGSASENWGIYDVPFSRPAWQLSSFLALQIPVTRSGWQVNVAAALDRGGLYVDQLGFYVGLRKSWLKPRKCPAPSAYQNIHGFPVQQL